MIFMVKLPLFIAFCITVPMSATLGTELDEKNRLVSAMMDPDLAPNGRNMLI